MLKYVSKFALDILPSVVATIIGAYIVNHYIVTRPGRTRRSPPRCRRSTPKRPETARTSAKPSETSSDVASFPEPGVRAKGISEKAILEKSAVEKSAENPLTSRRRPRAFPRKRGGISRAPREKAIAKAVQAPVPAPVVAAPTTAPPVEAAVAPEEHRDANDLARAAIERLRGASDGSPRAQEAARTRTRLAFPDAPRVCRTGRRRRRFGRFRRRSWSPRPQPRRSIRRPDRHR